MIEEPIIDEIGTQQDKLNYDDVVNLKEKYVAEKMGVEEVKMYVSKEGGYVSEYKDIYDLEEGDIFEYKYVRDDGAERSCIIYLDEFIRGYDDFTEEYTDKVSRIVLFIVDEDGYEKMPFQWPQQAYAGSHIATDGVMFQTDDGYIRYGELNTSAGCYTKK